MQEVSIEIFLGGGDHPLSFFLDIFNVPSPVSPFNLVLSQNAWLVLPSSGT